MTYEEFSAWVYSEAGTIVKQNPHIRLGQAVFNLLDECYGVSRELQFKYGIDCFFANEGNPLIEEFVKKAYEVLKEYKIL